MFTFNNRELNTKYDYKTVKIKRICQPEEYGMTQKWYGGNCKKLVELQEEPLILICNEDNRTIDILVVKESLSKLPIEMLKLIYAKYIGDEKASKNEMIQQLTA